MKTAAEATLAERLGEVLHEWWDDDHGEGSRHACRPVPSEDEFLALAKAHGISIYLDGAEPEPLRTAAENAELNSLFDLQWTRMQEATEHWRRSHPGNNRVQPDLGRLLTWLLEDRKHLLKIAMSARQIGSLVSERDHAMENERRG